MKPALTGKRLLLLSGAALLSAAALLAIGILLFGDFDATEGRILATTALLAGYGLLALPGAVLQDRRRLLALAAAVFALAGAGAALAVAAVWAEDPPAALGKTIGTINGWLVAAVQVAALSLRARERDPRSVRWLFAASSALVVVLAAMLTVLVWVGFDSEGYGRVFAALIVLNVLLVALQPLLAWARPRRTAHRLRFLVAPDETVELVVEAPDFAGAAGLGIRTLERNGRRVLAVELADRMRGARPGDNASDEAGGIAVRRFVVARGPADARVRPGGTAAP